MNDSTRMTTERFFGGVDGRIETLYETVGYVADHTPSDDQLTEWILQHTSAGTAAVVRRNIAFLQSIDLLRRSDDGFELTNKGDAFRTQKEPAVAYKGLATAVDGFRELARAIPQGNRTVDDLQARLRAAYPDYSLPTGVVQKHLDWFVSLGLVTLANGQYAFPFEGGTFDIGQQYSRWLLHDVLKGERYKGISTPADEPLILLFTGDSGSEYGYEDEFLDDDTFLYTGEGTEGEMTMTGGNKAIRDHKTNGKAIHVFEDTALPWMVSYVGEFEYVAHQEDSLADVDGRMRNAIRFKLAPVGGTEVTLEEGTPRSLPLEELFAKAQQSSPRSTSSDTTSTTSSSGRRYSRSEVVREFALRMADGVCQGCEQPAPFEDSAGQPFLEVHHLRRLKDGGPDAPENVIALCPNCHRRRHHGHDGDAFNEQLIEKAQVRNERFARD